MLAVKFVYLNYFAIMLICFKYIVFNYFLVWIAKFYYVEKLRIKFLSYLLRKSYRIN